MTNMDITNCSAVTDIIINIGYNVPYQNLRVGGIAGVWHNQTGTTVEMTNCDISENTVVRTVVDGVETDVTETNGNYGAAYTESKLAEGGSLLIAEAVKTEDGNT